MGATPLPILWEDHLRDISSVFADLARILNETATVRITPIHSGI